MQARVRLGAVAHFTLAVRDPAESAKWWSSHFDLMVQFFPDGTARLSNGYVMFGLFAGEPHPNTGEHRAFSLPDPLALDAASATLAKNGVALTNRDDAAGPFAPGSPAVGRWFHDPDGYRWELFVRPPISA